MKNLNRFYVEQKENELKKLEEKAASLENQIQKEENTAEKNREEFEKLQFVNAQLREQYNKLKTMIIGMGILLDIENNNYNIVEWENLYLKRKGNKYNIVNKDETELFVFDKDISSILQEISKDGYSCSIVVIRIYAKIIKVQLRFLQQEK